MGLKTLQNNIARRVRRKRKIRGTVSGTAEVPRLTVYKSLRHLYAQLIDDEAGRTVAAVTTNTKENKKAGGSFAHVKHAQAIGAEIAKKAKKLKITRVVFDRNGWIYHGVVKAIADAARKEGLKF